MISRTRTLVRLAVVGAVLGALGLVSTASAAWSLDYYLPQGTSTINPYFSGTTFCTSYFNASHRLQSTVYEYSMLKKVQVQSVRVHSGTENDGGNNYIWTSVVMIDQTDGSNWYYENSVAGYSFGSDLTRYPYHVLNYNNGGWPAVIEPRWANTSYSCYYATDAVLYGPNN